MLRLAVASREETFERVRGPLAERDVEVVHLRAKERTLDLADPDLPDVDVGFVFPTRLMEGGAIAANLDVPWVNGRETVLTSRNKAEVLTRLSTAGLSVPETALVSNPVDDDAVLEAASDVGFPLVVKPNSTTRGVGIARVDDPDSLLGVVDYLDLVHDFRATGDKSFLLQEYVPGARDYRAMVVDSAFAGAVERRLPEEALAAGRWKHNVHRGAEAVGVDLDPDARDLAERAAGVMGIDWLGVDLLATDQRLVVTETNARPTVDEATKYEPGFYDRLAALIRKTVE